MTAPRPRERLSDSTAIHLSCFGRVRAIVDFAWWRRLLLVVAASLAMLAVFSREAHAQSSARRNDGAAVALDVSLEQSAAGTRIIVLLDRDVTVEERADSTHVVYRLVATRAGGRRLPVVAPAGEGPVGHVELVPAGRDLELVIDVRRSVVRHHRFVKSLEGFDFQVDLDELPGRRPPARSAPAPLPGNPSGSIPLSSSSPAPGAGSSSPPASPRGSISLPASPPAPGPGAGSSSPPQKVPDEDVSRTLGGHTFLAPVRGPSPFVTTHFGLSLTVAHATFPGIDLHDKTAYSGALGALAARLELGVRILPRLGLLVAGGGRVVSGLNGPSALNLGADGHGFWLLGLQGVVARIESTGTQIGAQLSAGGIRGGRVSPITGIVDQVIATRKAPSVADFLGSASSDTGTFTWSVAQAIGPHASAQAWMGFAALWSTSGGRPTDHAVDMSGGLALTVDGFPWVPLALLAEYDGDAIVSRFSPGDASLSAILSDRGRSSLLTGLYYTGRRAFRVGVLGGTASRGAGTAGPSAIGRLEVECYF